MNKIALASILLAQIAFAAPVFADEPDNTTEDRGLVEPGPVRVIPTVTPQEAAPAPLAVTIGGITDGKPIAKKFAYCVPDGKGQTTDGENISPAISWTGAPDSTQSYAVIVVDKDVPLSFDNANKQGASIATNAPRQNFYHWVLVDIPPNVLGILEGRDSNRVVKNGGKPYGRTTYGTNGQNDYVKVSAGPNGGYDGPCPPWNDERLHHYHFIVYALDIPSLGLPNPVRGGQAEAVMKGHILAKGEVVGTYSDNVRWLATLDAQSSATEDQ